MNVVALNELKIEPDILFLDTFDWLMRRVLVCVAA